AWLDGTLDNHGWLLLGNESTNKTAKLVESRENGTTGNRPVLVVDFTPTGTTGACCFASGACTIVTDALDCTTAGGTYQGDGTVCTPNPCPQPTGACCLPGGTCNVLTATDCATANGVYQGDDTSCVPNPCPIFLEPFVDALPIPALATPVAGSAGGVATYDMAIRETEQQLHRDLALTTVWGYDDGTGTTYPGPTILASAGNAVTVNWSNDLRYSSGASQGELRQEHYLPVDLCPHGPDHEGDTARTVVHLHGGHVPPKFDGYPEHTQLPGESVQYVYGNDQLGAPLWYHDHALGITRLNVIMGLAGFYLLRDATEQALIDNGDLPSGEFEVGLAIQDRTFDANGEFVYPADWQDMWYGDKILVNGKVWPFLQVKRGKYRFHLLNGSTTRSYTLSLSGGATFTIIGNDGGLLDAPVGPVSTVNFGPGERIGVVVDFQPFGNGTEILMTNSAPVPPGEPVVADVMKFVVQGGGGFTNPLPATLRNNEVLLEGDAVRTRDFLLQKDSINGPACSNNTWWLINGLTWNDITEYPELDTIEIWKFQNPSGMMHPMHMHLVFFQVLDRQPLGGGAPLPLEPWEAGWKDTVRVEPGTEVRVIARFEDYEGKYAYHCHILEHEDHEMMRQFVAVQNCPADTDRSTEVDVTDLLAVLATWGPCPLPCSDLSELQDPDTCPEDTNRDCEVDVTDLLEVLAKWGPCP
ncbi:MAG: multicopper oxidase family protein, partial [Planctomycetota bacterium]